MLQLLDEGRNEGLAVATIDATSDGGRWPAAEWGFHIPSDELDGRRGEQARRAELAYSEATICYEEWLKTASADGIEFEVWFWRDS